jgi:hypothetical protein
MPGLAVAEDFMSEEEEKNIVEFLDTQTWETELARRVQQFGYRFFYETQTIDFEVRMLLCIVYFGQVLIR